MKVILKEDVPHLGDSGDIVNVKPGYGRNYLVTQGLADLATPRNIKEMEHKLRVIKKQIDAAKAEVAEVKARLEQISVTIAKSAGDNDKLFGSVTSADIQKALAVENLKIDKRHIIIDEPIKSLGDFTVKAKLFGGELAEFKVWVVKQ
ncbi:MAG: 50S ribosomal protein L9 [Deltaproteobacteria bacterium]|nr:50S ribosomal protein L9 [Deltaproteobacteria bacterium]MBN2670093.1 50S ribosomal protein L9 [Deltaproteobacteria bacterium]